jgi:drug/metabolite transporter (DMT)-like permease
MVRVLIASLVATFSGAVGSVLMRKGMQAVGPLENYAPLELISFFWRALCQPYVIAGTVFSAVFYFAFLAALSWTDVTVAFPLTAFEYGFTALLAILVLREQVPAMRWIGIAIVTIGLLLIAMTERGGTPSVETQPRTTHS